MKGVHAYVVHCAKIHSTDSHFSTDEKSVILEFSAINDGRSMLAMFLAIQYWLEGIETEALK